MDFNKINIEEISNLETIDLENEILKLIANIEKTEEFEDSGPFFISLEKIQSILATLLFKYSKEVSPFTRKFIYDFDRIDDVETQKYLYSVIKAKQYLNS